MAEFQLPDRESEAQEADYDAEKVQRASEGSDDGEQHEEEEEDEEGDELGSDAGAFQNVAQGLIGRHRNMLMQYWQDTINSIENDDHDFKNHHLPLARIKKVMKTDDEVRMISAEAPILFAKGCDVFITELTMRAWIHAEENKRRTLQRSDIAAALQKSDMFDFLIDIVPREEEKKRNTSSRASMSQQPPPQSNSLYHQHFLQQYQKHANPSAETESEDQHSISQDNQTETPAQSNATNEEGGGMGYLM